VIGVFRSGVRQIVDISGITVDGGVTTVGAGVKFFNAEGSLTGSVIRNVAPLTGPQGYGVVIASNLSADRIPVRVAGTQISGYAKAGVVLDSTQAAPQLGVLAVTLSANTITGAGPQAQTAQQGVLATGLVSGSITGNAITANQGAGDAASAGVRLVDLDLTPTTTGGTTTKLTATGNNITGNGFGARNETGAGADQAAAFTATGNWWGSAAGPSLTTPPPAGDRVNGAAINFSSFRTTAIATPTVPTAVADLAPTGELDSPSGSGIVRPGKAYFVFAAADDDFGVKSVAFKAGATELGSDGEAPYEAPSQWTPGDDLEGQDVTLTATITDSAGQATTRSVTVKVQSPAPEPTPEAFGETPTPTPTPVPVVVAAAKKLSPPSRLTLAASASSGRRVTLSGAVTMPSGGACPAGAEVRLSLYHAAVMLRRVMANLGADCRYRVTLRMTRLAAGHKVVVKARFLTQGGMLARSAPSCTLTVRR
jgi:hypothetical protein